MDKSEILDKHRGGFGPELTKVQQEWVMLAMEQYASEERKKAAIAFAHRLDADMYMEFGGFTIGTAKIIELYDNWSKNK